MNTLKAKTKGGDEGREKIMGKNEEKSQLLRRIKARRLLNKQKPLLPTKHATTNKLEIFLADGKNETKKG